MSKHLFLTASFLLAIITLSAFYKSDDGRAGYTGSPGETACNNASCHTSFGLNSGPGNLALTSNIPAAGYVPGQTYQMQLKVKQTGRSLFGLAVEALTETNNNAGTLVATDAVRTWIKSRTVSGVSRKNIVHKKNGGAQVDSMTFNFDWQAPTTAGGVVKFYFASVAANANDNTSGDHVYNGSVSVNPQSSAANEANADLLSVQVSPNPVVDKLTVAYTLQEKTEVNLSLFSMTGQLVKAVSLGQMAPGQHQNYFGIDNNIAKGIYLLEIKTNNGSTTKRVMIE